MSDGESLGFWSSVWVPWRVGWFCVLVALRDLSDAIDVFLIVVLFWMYWFFFFNESIQSIGF